jgi:hypothetical protein
MDNSSRDNPSSLTIPINKNIMYNLARDISDNTKSLVEIEDPDNN